MGKKEELGDRKFGWLEVIKFSSISKGKTFWLCRCQCGVVKPIRADALKNGRKSCGCAIALAAAVCEDLTGRKFNKLRVIRRDDERTGSGAIRWVCQCRCGQIKSINGCSLRSGHAKSCGCLQREKAADQAKVMGAANRTHGMSSSPEYAVWHGMRQRCSDPNLPEYKHYGGRGIKVCPRWKKFENFLADMGLRPGPKYSLDRKETNGNYTPTNCRWATQKTQQRNRRSNLPVEYQGETRCLSEWAEKYGLTTLQLWSKIRMMGWSIHEALTMPIAKTIGDKRKYKVLRTRQSIPVGGHRRAIA